MLSAGAIGLFATGASTQGPRFYSDDPIAREPESQDASKAAPYDQSQMYELLYNLFVTSGYQPTGLRAKNINTIDEVPDSSWFTNRIVARAMTTSQPARGPNAGAPPDPSKWVLIEAKDLRGAPGLHGDGRQGTDLVPRVRIPAARSGGRDSGRGGRRQDFLGARLQPGRIVHHYLRSQEHHD